MIEKVHVIPGAGRLVKLPGGRIVPPEGFICPLNTFIQRRINCGDLVVVPDAAAAAATPDATMAAAATPAAATAAALAVDQAPIEAAIEAAVENAVAAKTAVKKGA